MHMIAETTLSVVNVCEFRVAAGLAKVETYGNNNTSVIRYSPEC